MSPLPVLAWPNFGQSGHLGSKAVDNSCPLCLSNINLCIFMHANAHVALPDTQGTVHTTCTACTHSLLPPVTNTQALPRWKVPAAAGQKQEEHTV